MTGWVKAEPDPAIEAVGRFLWRRQLRAGGVAPGYSQEAADKLWDWMARGQKAALEAEAMDLVAVVDRARA